jgi:hypothetical protein
MGGSVTVIDAVTVRDGWRDGLTCTFAGKRDGRTGRRDGPLTVTDTVTPVTVPRFGPHDVGSATVGK